MKIKYPFLVIFALILIFSACQKEETGEVINFCGVPEATASFSGVLHFNGENLASSKLRVHMVDTVPGSTYFSFNFTEYRTSDTHLVNTGVFYSIPFLINDTTYLSEALKFSNFFSHLTYVQEECDAIGGSWKNDSSGYFYVERLDSLNYFVDARARLVSDYGQNGNTPTSDTIKVRIKGVFTLF